MSETPKAASGNGRRGSGGCASPAAKAKTTKAAIRATLSRTAPFCTCAPRRTS